MIRSSKLITLAFTLTLAALLAPPAGAQAPSPVGTWYVVIDYGGSWTSQLITILSDNTLRTTVVSTTTVTATATVRSCHMATDRVSINGRGFASKRPATWMATCCASTPEV